MRKIPVVAIVLTLFVSCVSTDSRSAEDGVRAVEKEWNESRIAGDARRVAALLDDGWTAIHVDGRIEQKAPYVEGIASGGRHILAVNVITQSIRVEPPVAIVTGEVVQRGFRRGEMREGHLRYTHVWVRHGSSWRMVTSQATELRPE